jgi:hypothetical protein
MLDIVQPKNDDFNEDETYDKVLPHENYARNWPIIPVSRETNEPIVEWTGNKILLTGAFPDKFLFLTDCQLNEIGNIFSLSQWSIQWSFIHCSWFQSIAECMLHSKFG